MPFERKTNSSCTPSCLHHWYSLDELHLVHSRYIYHISHDRHDDDNDDDAIDYWNGHEVFAIMIIVAVFQILYFILGYFVHDVMDQRFYEEVGTDIELKDITTSQMRFWSMCKIDLQMVHTIPYTIIYNHIYMPSWCSLLMVINDDIMMVLYRWCYCYLQRSSILVGCQPSFLLYTMMIIMNDFNDTCN